MSADDNHFVRVDHITEVVRRELRRHTDDFLAPVIGEAIGKAMTQVRDELVAKLKETAICFKGEWSAGARYRRGDLVTSGGALHHANRDTQGTKPGTDASAFSCVAARGRDGRDGRDAHR